MKLSKVAIFLLPCFLWACSTTKPVQEKRPKKAEKTKQEKQKREYPAFVKYFQNRVSKAVRDESVFDSEDQIEWRRFQKGVSLCDGALLVEVTKVFPAPDRSGFIVQCKIVEPLIVRKEAVKGLEIELKVKDPDTVFSLPGEALPGERYILLVKLDQKKQVEGGGEYYTAWWQLYPRSDRVLEFLEKSRP